MYTVGLDSPMQRHIISLYHGNGAGVNCTLHPKNCAQASILACARHNQDDSPKKHQRSLVFKPLTIVKAHDMNIIGMYRSLASRLVQV